MMLSMKCLASLLVCATLWQVLWIGVSGDDNDAKDCTTFEEKSECCSSENDCVYINCTVNGEAEAACYNTTAGAPCDKDDEAVNTCGSDVTTSANSEEETTKALTEEEKEEDTTKAPTEEEKEEETTKAPTEEEKEDCSDYHTRKECCAAGNSTACVFLNCTNDEGEFINKECVAADGSRSCSGQNKTATNLCNAEDTPDGGESAGSTTAEPEDQKPTKSPTTGEDAGGQEFDAASFIGGVVLCAGLLAIGYFGLKFYRSRQERNYESM